MFRLSYLASWQLVALIWVGSTTFSSKYSVVDAFVIVQKAHKDWSLYDSNSKIKPLHSIEDDIRNTCTKKVAWDVSSLVGLSIGFFTLVAPLSSPLATMNSIANAADSKVVGSFSGSGLFFKDTLQVEAFEDPKVQGVKLYVSNFILPLNERLSSTKNLFSDPSSASLTCAKTGPVKVADNIVKGTGGEQVFEESKSLLFKSLKVQRVYDEENQTLIYVSYNTRLDKNDDSNKSRFKSSLCAIGLNSSDE